MTIEATTLGSGIKAAVLGITLTQVTARTGVMNGQTKEATREMYEAYIRDRTIRQDTKIDTTEATATGTEM